MQNNVSITWGGGNRIFLFCHKFLCLIFLRVGGQNISFYIFLEINFRVLTQRTTAHNHDLKNANKILAANLEKPIEGNNQKQPNIQWLSNIYQYLIYTIIKFYLILVCLLVEKHDNNNFLKDFLHIFPSGWLFRNLLCLTLISSDLKFVAPIKYSMSSECSLGLVFTPRTVFKIDVLRSAGKSWSSLKWLNYETYF